MHLTTQRNTFAQAWHRQGHWLVCLLAVVLVGYTLMEPATALYTISAPEEDVLVLSTTQLSQEAASLLATMSDATQVVSDEDVVLTAGQSITVSYHGALYATTTGAETVGNLLSRLGLAPGPLDVVVVDTTSSAPSILVDASFTYYEQVHEVAPFATQWVANPTMAEGMETVVQTGVDGYALNTYEVTYADGTLLSRQLVDQEESTAVDEIIEYGTAAPDVGRNDPLVDVVTFEDGSGYLSFESGATLTFSGTKAMTATAYTGGVGKVGWITATGTDVHVGVIAVDKRVIPLGTKMFVVTDSGIVYGTGVAEDTGVIGDIVDLYYDSEEECIQFGRRACTVYFID